jgi:ribosome-associated translation inhibitor RaiA
MQILVNSDNHIKGTESLTERVDSIVTAAVDRFADRITRVEVHLNDVNGPEKSGDRDKRCMMEARLGGLAPIAVTDEAASLLQAIEGAADKLQRALERALGRRDKADGRAPRADEIASTELLDTLEDGRDRTAPR